MRRLARTLLTRPLVVLGLAALLMPSVVRAAEPPITFGLAQVYGADKAAKGGKAIETYLSKALGRPVRSEVFKSYDDLAKALRRSKVDLAWIPPLALVRSLRASPVVPLVKVQRNGFWYNACVFAREGVGGTALASLKGLRAAWVDQGSTSGYLIPRAMLIKDGQTIKGFFAQEQFAGSHPAACSAVAEGKADVGATYTDASGKPVGCVKALGEAKAAKLRCVAVSERVPNEVIAARDGLDETLASDITGALTSLAESDEGRALLKDVFDAEAFGFAMEEDFDGLRGLAVDVETRESE